MYQTTPFFFLLACSGFKIKRFYELFTVWFYQTCFAPNCFIYVRSFSQWQGIDEHQTARTVYATAECPG